MEDWERIQIRRHRPLQVDQDGEMEGEVSGRCENRSLGVLASWGQEPFVLGESLLYYRD